MNRSESPSTALPPSPGLRRTSRAPSPPLGEKDGMRGYGSWKVLVLFLILAMASNPALAAERKPNILVVLADQWRAQAFGFAGDPNVRTPNFDRLASESIRFINAVAGMPVCSPTRASLLTGQRPLTHGVFLNDVPLNPNATTIAKVLKAEGYDTGS